MLGLRARGRGGWDATAPVAASKARFFGAPPRFFAQEQRNGVELAVGATTHCPGKRRTRTSPQTPTSPLPKSGEDDPRPPRQERSRGWWSHRGKKALFFGGSTPFLWASTKEMGSNRRTGQRPPPNVTAHTHKPKRKRGNPRRGFPLGPPPALIRAQESSALCGARPEALPLDSTTFEKVDETFKRARSAQKKKKGRRLAVLFLVGAGGFEPP